MPTREYYAEGEVLPGATPTMLYYGLDQIGGVRRVFASSGASPAYTYDPYGAPLQSAAPITDRGYAGMLTEPNSGLGLTLYRAYNPTTGRWLSRDPAGETTDQSLNLYGYVNANPINDNDPLGLCPRPQSKACTGPVMSLSFGGSGTFAIMGGFNAGADITLNIPTNINWAAPWQGFQVVGSAQAGGLLGAGLYAGVGVQRGVGYSATHATQGLSTNVGAQAEGDFGWGTGSVGASVQGNADGVSGSTGTKVGAGIGLYAGAGAYGNVQYASPSLGCQ